MIGVAADVALIVLAVLVAAFTVLYVVRSPWERNEIGRIYATKSVVLSLVMVQITLSVWVSAEYPGRQWARLVIYAAGALVYVPMIVSLVRHQQEDRRRYREQKEAGS